MMQPKASNNCSNSQPRKGAVSVASLDALRDLPDSVKEARLGERQFARHSNRNGTTGGFVESTAMTTPFVTISKRSLVIEHAMVKESARLDGEITIRGNAHVFESARLSGKMEIGGSLQVSSDINNDTFSFDGSTSTVLLRGNSWGIRNPE